MRIKLIQNQVAKFNFLGDEESLAFSMAIVDDNDKTIERDGIKAIVKLRTDDDPLNKRDELQDLYYAGEFDEIVRQCIENGRERDIEELRVFIVTYVDNFNTLRDDFESKRRQELQKKIHALTEELRDVRMPPAHYEMADAIKDLADRNRYKESQYRGWMKDYKEDSDTYKRYEKSALEHSAKAAELMAEYERLYIICDKLCNETSTAQ